MTGAQQTQTAGGAKAIPPGAGITKRAFYNKQDRPLVTVMFPNGGPGLKIGVVFDAIPVRILIAEQADQLVALLREMTIAGAAPPRMLTRANALLDAIEGRQS